MRHRRPDERQWLPRLCRTSPGADFKPGDVVVLDNLSAHKVPGYVKRSKPQAQSCFTCRPIRRTSIRSSSCLQNSKPCYERPPSAPWKASGTASHAFSMPSGPMNAQTTSATPDMLHAKWKMLSDSRTLMTRRMGPRLRARACTLCRGLIWTAKRVWRHFQPLILRSRALARRLEGWPRALVAILRDAAKRPLLRMRAVLGWSSASP